MYVLRFCQLKVAVRVDKMELICTELCISHNDEVLLTSALLRFTFEIVPIVWQAHLPDVQWRSASFYSGCVPLTLPSSSSSVVVSHPMCIAYVMMFRQFCCHRCRLRIVIVMTDAILVVVWHTIRAKMRQILLRYRKLCYVARDAGIELNCLRKFWHCCSATTRTGAYSCKTSPMTTNRCELFWTEFQLREGGRQAAWARHYIEKTCVLSVVVVFVATTGKVHVSPKSF